MSGDLPKPFGDVVTDGLAEKTGEDPADGEHPRAGSPGGGAFATQAGPRCN